jgi:uncharacterized protein (DUF305 family)
MIGRHFSGVADMQKRAISAKAIFILAAAICLAGAHGVAAQQPTITAKVAPGTSSSRPSDEAPFLAENNTAMDKMMAGMNVKPTGDVDRDFAAMMIPHHQGAIDMAQSEFRYGRNEQLRRIAQEIIVEQQQEITAMRLALGQPLPPSATAPDQPSDLKASTPDSHQHKEP